MVGVYVLSMFLFANHEASGANYTGTFLARLLPHLSGAELRQLVVVGRKIGHVLAYGVLTLIVYFAANKTKRLRRAALPVAVVFALAVAMADEGYQSSLNHRTGTFDDVLIDGFGIGLATLSLWIGTWLRKKHKEVAEDVEDERR